MIIILDGSKVHWYDYLYLFMFVIHAANASLFVRAHFTTPLDPCVILLFSTTVLYQIIKRIKFNRGFVQLLVVFMGYVLLTAIIYVNLAPFFIVQWFLTFYMAYVICQGLGRQLFPLFETIVFHLCIISLICFPFLIIAPEALIKLVTRFQFSENYNDVMEVLNCVVYTVIPDLIYHMDTEWHLFPRNCGFAWEPGAFACFIGLAIFCHSLRGKISIKGNLPMIVFLAALVTTESTTGFFMIGMMALVWVIVEKHYVFALLLLPLVSYVAALPFLGAKFDAQVVDLEHSIAGGSLSGERLPALYICWTEFIQHPILGIGGKNTWYEDAQIAVFSGIGTLFARFGLVMSGLYWFIITKTSKLANAVFKTNNGYILIPCILALMVSYNTWNKPLFIAFCFWCIFTKKEGLYLHRTV